MKQFQTTAIILSRTDYGEADRILTLLTPDHGKLRLMARGVRRVKSKLAGGIELFSVSQLSFMPGRGELGTLVSTRLISHYGHIVQNIERVQLGYELIKNINRATEDQPEPEYFELLRNAFIALDSSEISGDLIKLWFLGSLLRLAGHQPNLQTDISGKQLQAGQSYEFDFDAMACVLRPDGVLTSDHIKFLRLALNDNAPSALSRIKGSEQLVKELLSLVQTMAQLHIRL